MGNCVSVDSSSLIICCYDRAAVEVMYVWQFKDNLDDLKASRDQLTASRDDLRRGVENQEGPQMKRLATVEQWLDSVENKLLEVNKLISDGDKEIAENMCLGGCCYKNSISSYSLGRSFVDAKQQVDILKQQSGEFEALVEKIPVEPEYLRQLKRNLEDLEAARNDLKALKDDVMRRVKREEGGQMKRLEIVQGWFKKVDALITEVDMLIRNGPQEIEKWSVKNFSNNGFGDKVAERLKHVSSLKNEGDFPVVVEKETAESEYIGKVEDNLKSLKKARQELWGLKEDVTRKVKTEEERQQKKRLQQVEVWRKNAEVSIAETDMLLKEAPEEVKKMRQGGSCSNFGEKVIKRLKSVIDLKNNGDFSEVADAALPEKVVEIECGQPVGLQTKIDEVWSLLMKREVGILGLYGMGGVGKTTLLTHINNKFLDTPSDFDFVIWVTVSKDFTLSKVQEEIGERIGISINDWKKKNIEEKKKDIFSTLRNKKFVLLLDDLWEKVHLEKAGVPIPKRQNGCKIVLTTRSELVCSLMDARKRIKVEKLPSDQAWQLFEDNVGELDSAIIPTAKLVAQECDGLPLALIVVARAMACSKTLDDWRYALADLRQSASNLQGLEEEVFARLKYSYDRLPDNKYRTCFLYCALFPEDFKIYKNDLIDYWISEKLEDGEDNEGISRSLAHHVIRDLINACLLEEEGSYVKMHDVLRDTALWISCKVEKPKYNFLVQAGKHLSKAPEVKKWEGVKRASLMGNSIQNLPEVSVCPGLCTLLLCRNPYLNEISGKIFQLWHALTVLDLSNTRVQELPLGISEMSSLQYLNLSHTWIEELPLELKRLTKLRYLNLEHNAFLGIIPKEVISSFPSLQVLRMFCCGFFYKEMKDNILSDSYMHIKVLQRMEHLNVVSITIRSPDALQLYFSMPKMQCYTQALSLECFTGSNAIEFSPAEKMEELKTLHINASEDLEKINFKPKFLRENLCFSSLREVCVEHCPKLSNLSWLILAPNLVVLKVAVCRNMEEIINDKKCSKVSEESENLKPFTKLEILILEDLPQLKSINWNSLLLPSIKRMRILDCPMLKKLPLKSMGRKITIEAEQQWWNSVEWEDEDTKAPFISSFRSCPPRTRICRAAHHYFDIWSSK